MGTLSYRLSYSFSPKLESVGFRVILGVKIYLAFITLFVIPLPMQNSVENISMKCEIMFLFSLISDQQWLKTVADLLSGLLICLSPRVLAADQISISHQICCDSNLAQSTPGTQCRHGS